MQLTFDKFPPSEATARYFDLMAFVDNALEAARIIEATYTPEQAEQRRRSVPEDERPSTARNVSFTASFPSGTNPTAAVIAEGLLHGPVSLPGSYVSVRLDITVARRTAQGVRRWPKADGSKDKKRKDPEGHTVYVEGLFLFDNLDEFDHDLAVQGALGLYSGQEAYRRKAEAALTWFYSRNINYLL